MHRFFVEEKALALGSQVTLSREESLHAARVLRLKRGEEVQLLNGEKLYAGQAAEVSETSVSVQVTGLLPSPEPPLRVTLLQGLPKGDKLEMILQKATELGVWQALPVEMERSVAKGGWQEKKLDRYRRIALEAAKQSGRAHVPEIGEARSFSSLCAEWEKTGKGLPWDGAFVAWEEETATPLSQAVREWQGRQNQQEGQSAHIALVIGPEGGITQAECQRLMALGAKTVTLGKRILRTETAGLCALSVLWAALGEM